MNETAFLFLKYAKEGGEMRMVHAQNATVACACTGMVAAAPVLYFLAIITLATVVQYVVQQAVLICAYQRASVKHGRIKGRNCPCTTTVCMILRILYRYHTHDYAVGGGHPKRLKVSPLSLNLDLSLLTAVLHQQYGEREVVLLTKEQ